MSKKIDQISKAILEEVQSSIRFDDGDDYSSVEVTKNRAEKVVINLTVGAIDRGPRQDHGGGDDGDDWMDDNQLDSVQEEYFSKNKPVAEKIERIISSHLGDKFTIRRQFDYGEKGHIDIYFTITEN